MPRAHRLARFETNKFFYLKNALGSLPTTYIADGVVVKLEVVGLAPWSILVVNHLKRSNDS
jgi:hypothetical protein